MTAAKEDVLNWTLEGVVKGAEYMFIVKDLTSNIYNPVWIMPNESLHRKRKQIPKGKFIEDAINILYAKEYFENHRHYSCKFPEE